MKKNLSIRRLVHFLAFVFFYSFSSQLYSKGMTECSDAKTSGVCEDIVDTAINVCEDKQSGKAITAKALKSSQEGTFGNDTNFGQLIGKYKNVKKSAQSDAKNQKACRKAALALKKDCEKKCEGDDAPSCEKGQESLDEIADFCKKNEEKAEEIAAEAEADIQTLANGSNSSQSSLSASSSTSLAGGDGGSGGSIDLGDTDTGNSTAPGGRDLGSLLDKGGEGGEDNSNNILSGSGSNGGGASGAAGGGNLSASDPSLDGSGVNKGIVSDGSNSDLDALAAARKAGGSGSGGAGDASNKLKGGESPVAPGYMFLGTPSKKATSLIPAFQKKEAAAASRLHQKSSGSSTHKQNSGTSVKAKSPQTVPQKN